MNYFWLESIMCYHVCGSYILKVDVKIELRLDTQLVLNMQYFKFVMISCLCYLYREKRKRKKQLGLNNAIGLTLETPKH